MTPDSFAAFWIAYPRRVAKKAAEKVWARVATSPEVIEQIMAGLNRQMGRKLNLWNRKDLKFIPYPATWLNGRRWEDEQQVSKLADRRVIACEKCADTGVASGINGHGERLMVRCPCPAGQLPGALAGVTEEAL